MHEASSVIPSLLQVKSYFFSFAVVNILTTGDIAIMIIKPLYLTLNLKVCTPEMLITAQEIWDINVLIILIMMSNWARIAL